MIEIRGLAGPDRAAWGRLRLALWPGDDPAEWDPVLADPQIAVFGAFTAKALIGFAEVAIRPHGDGCETAPVAWLEGIFVVPDHRGRGVARRLVAAAETWARARGLRELGSDAPIDNAASIAAHGRWGFAETERVVMFRKDLT